jgi:hypothetical protein
MPTFTEFYEDDMNANVFLEDGTEYLGVPLLVDIQPPLVGFMSDDCAIIIPIEKVKRIEVYEP